MIHRRVRIVAVVESFVFGARHMEKSVGGQILIVELASFSSDFRHQTAFRREPQPSRPSWLVSSAD